MKKLYKNGHEIGKVYETDDHYIYVESNGSKHKVSRMLVCYMDNAYHGTMEFTGLH